MSQPDLMVLGSLEQAVCPRCRHMAVMRSDAQGESGVWSVNSCVHCCFSWRSTEDVMRVLEITDGKAFRLWDSEIENLPVPLVVTSV